MGHDRGSVNPVDSDEFSNTGSGRVGLDHLEDLLGIQPDLGLLQLAELAQGVFNAFLSFLPRCLSDRN